MINLILTVSIVLSGIVQYNGFSWIKESSILPKLMTNFNGNIFKKMNAIIIAPILCSGLILNEAALAEMTNAPWSSETQYELLKAAPNGAQPKAGDLVIVRFKGSYKGVVFDDTISTKDPYFYRCGVNLIVKGLDDTVLNMHVGEKAHVIFAGDLAFPNGRPSAPGKPRIPAGAPLDYEVELVDLPGIGDDFIADVDDE